MESSNPEALQGPQGKGWLLADAAALNLQHPRTFLVPKRDERESACVGDLCKVCFLYEDAEVGGERMWLILVCVEGEHADRTYIGALNSTPVYSPTLRRGDFVRFRPEHIADLVCSPANPRHPDYWPGWQAIFGAARVGSFQV